MKLVNSDDLYCGYKSNGFLNVNILSIVLDRIQCRISFIHSSDLKSKILYFLLKSQLAMAWLKKDLSYPKVYNFFQQINLKILFLAINKKQLSTSSLKNNRDTLTRYRKWNYCTRPECFKRLLVKNHSKPQVCLSFEYPRSRTVIILQTKYTVW